MGVQHKGNGKFRLTYIDFTETAKKKKTVWRSKIYYTYTPSGVKITTARGNKTLISKREKELQEEVKRLENESKRKLSNQKLNPKKVVVNDKFNLYYILVNVLEKTPCRSNKPKSVANARRVINELSTFVAKKHPTMSVYEFKDSHAREFIRSYKSHSISSIRTYVRIMRSAWRILDEHLRDINEESVENVWKRINPDFVKSVAEQKKVMRYSAFSREWLHNFFSWLKEHNENNRYEAFALLFLTGWRRHDVLHLTSGNVNFEHKYISVTHSKTEETTGATTYIYLTDFLCELLASLPKRRNGRLFALGESTLRTTLDYYCEHVETPVDYRIADVGRYKRRSHTPHAFRRSCITHLKSEHFAGDLVNYITGHSGGTVEERHYNRFCVDYKSATEEAMLYLESIVKGEECANLTLDAVLHKLKMTKKQLAELMAA